MGNKEQQLWDLLEPIHTSAGAFCRTLAGSREEGDDLYQDAVCRALTRFGQLSEPTAFRPWLYRIIVNCHRNRVSSPWWRRSERLTPDNEAVLPAERISGPVHARMRLAVAMKPLSVRDRALVLLFETEGWSISELAELAGMSVDAVKARLSRARRKMKSALMSFLTSRTDVSVPGWSEKENEICVANKRSRE